MFGLSLEVGVNVEAPSVLLTNAEATNCTLKKSLTEALKHLGFYIACFRQVIFGNRSKVFFVEKEQHFADFNTKQSEQRAFHGFQGST